MNFWKSVKINIVNKYIMNTYMKKTIILLHIILLCNSCGKTINEQEIIDAFIGVNEKLDMSKLKVGDKFQGGKIAYIYQSNDPTYINGEVHGIIAALADLKYLYNWSYNSYEFDYANYSQLGTGIQNTNTIVSIEGDREYAANACYSLSLNGYDDWVLPSLEELKKLYQNKKVIGNFNDNNFDNSYYWSSTESSDDSRYAWGVNFQYGTSLDKDKLTRKLVRPIRYF